MKKTRRTLSWLAVACLLTLSPRAFAQGCTTHTGLTFATYVDGSGQTQELKLELLVPSGAPSPLPVVIWIHGGGWSTGSRLPIPAGVSALCSRGYAVASVDYRLSGPGARWPSQLHDVKGAVRWLREQAATYGLDPDRFAAWGQSAGAQLASMLGVTGTTGTAAGVGNGDPFTFGNVTLDLEGTVGGNPGPSSRVQAVVSWFGYSDFLQMRFFPTPTTDHDAANSAESRLLGGPIQDLPELAATANAMTFASADDPPFLLMHGALDELVPFHQSELLAAALRAHGVPVTFVPVPNAGHGGGGFTTPANYQTVYDYLAAVLAAAPTTRVSVQAVAPTAAEAGTAGSFRISRTGNIASPLTVRWDLQGTATLGADYSAPFFVTIPAGAASVTIPVVPANDPLVEGDETVVVALAHDPAYGVEAARAQALVTIADNQSVAGLPAVQVTATDPAASEDGDPGAFTFSIDAPAPPEGLAVRYTVSGTAIHGVDVEPLEGELTIPAGETSAEIPVIPVDDAVLEGSEVVIVTLAAGAGYVRGAPPSLATAGVRIADTDFDPAVPVVSIVATDFTAAEPGTNTGTFTVTRTGSTAGSLIAFLRSGGEAREGSDYLTLPDGVIFDAGVSRVTVTVTPAGDSLAEGAEAVTLATEADPGFLPGPQSGVVTLADDEITGTAGYYPVRPCRLVDTRGLMGPRGAPSLPCDGTVRAFELTGACGIPPEATAISANVVAVAPTVAGHLSLFQIGAPVQTSAANFTAGQTRANNAILPLSGTPGTLAALCGGAGPGQVHLVLDVNGYFR